MSEDGTTATNPGTNSLAEYVKSATSHNTGYRYAEIHFIEQGIGTNSGLGVVKNDPAQTWLGNNVDMLALWGGGSAGNLYSAGSILSSGALQQINEGYVLRISARDGLRVWFEVHNGTTGYMIGGGDPLADTLPTFDFGGTFGLAGDISIAFTPYGTVSDPVSAQIKTTVTEFAHATNGALPWDE